MSAGPPILLVRVEFEAVPCAVVLAASAEDEQRVRVWLASAAARRRVLAAVEAALVQLAAGRRAA